MATLDNFLLGATDGNAGVGKIGAFMAFNQTYSPTDRRPEPLGDRGGALPVIKVPVIKRVAPGVILHLAQKRVRLFLIP